MRTLAQIDAEITGLMLERQNLASISQELGFSKQKGLPLFEVLGARKPTFAGGLHILPIYNPLLGWVGVGFSEKALKNFLEDLELNDSKLPHTSH